jgi:hypothetical protein
MTGADDRQAERPQGLAFRSDVAALRETSRELREKADVLRARSAELRRLSKSLRPQGDETLGVTNGTGREAVTGVLLGEGSPDAKRKAGREQAR